MSCSWAPALASSSALSLPGVPTCAFTQDSFTVLLSASLFSTCTVSAASEDLNLRFVSVQSEENESE